MTENSSLMSKVVAVQDNFDILADDLSKCVQILLALLKKREDINLAENVTNLFSNIYELTTTVSQVCQEIRTLSTQFCQEISTLRTSVSQLRQEIREAQLDESLEFILLVVLRNQLEQTIKHFEKYMETVQQEITKRVKVIAEEIKNAHENLTKMIKVLE